MEVFKTSAGDIAAEREPGRTLLTVDLSNIKRNPRQIFVAYPYVIPERDYRAVFATVGKAFDVKFEYADEKITTLHVLQKIYTMIRSSAFGVYDITGWNPNVTLELGIAYGLSEAAYLIVNPTAHASAEAPADLRGLDRIEYRSYAELSDGLTKLLTTIMPPEPAGDPDDYIRDVQRKAIGLLERSDGLRMLDIASALKVAMPIAQAAVRPLVGETLEIKGATRAARYYLIGEAEEPKKT
jgi:hypothetical protein